MVPEYYTYVCAACAFTVKRHRSLGLPRKWVRVERDCFCDKCADSVEVE